MIHHYGIMGSFSNPSLRQFTRTVFGTAGIVSFCAIIFAVAVFNGKSFDIRSIAARGDVTYKVWDFRRGNEGWTSTNDTTVADGRIMIRATRVGQKTVSEQPAIFRFANSNVSLSGRGAKRIELKAKVYSETSPTTKSIPVTVRYSHQGETTIRTLPSFTIPISSRYSVGTAIFPEIESFILGNIELEFPKDNNISIERISLKGSIIRQTIAPTPSAAPTRMPTTTPSPTTAKASPTLIPSVTTAPASTNPSSVIYNADFESGNFQSLTGNTSWEGPIGAYFGKGVYHKEEVVKSPAKGNYAAALTIGSGDTTAAYLFTYAAAFPSSGKGTYSADYYIPSTITPSDWWNIWQWKSKDTTYDKPIISLNLVKINGVLQLRMSYVPGGTSANATQMIYQTNPIPFPTDTWVTVSGYYEAKTDNTGLVRIYQNGTQVFEKTGIMTKPGNAPVLWSVNSYADAISPNPATIYVDNMTVKN